jgi:hypothetical protein
MQTSFSRDMTREGWRLVDDVKNVREISIPNLSILPLPRRNPREIVDSDGGVYVRVAPVSGAKMRSFAKEKGADFGQRHAEYMLEHAKDIPRWWRRYAIIFPGTVWRDSERKLRVPRLWYEVTDFSTGTGAWRLDFLPLAGNWARHEGDQTRLLRPRT